MRILLPAILALALASPWAVSAQAAGSQNASLVNQLNRLGLKYKTTDAGNYSLTYDLDAGRSQVVYIMGTTEKVDNVEVRELWSRAGDFDSAPGADVMQSLMEESGSSKIGFWALEEKDGGGYTLYFSVKVPTYLRDSDLTSLLEYTANTADQKEKELFDTDQE